MFDRNTPYNDLSLLPLKESGIETIELLKKSIEARKKLGELNASLLSLPNVHNLNSSLFLMEAKESSAIENIVTTTDELFTPMEEGAKSPFQKEVERYNQALYHGMQYIDNNNPLCTGFYEDLVKLLKKNDGGIRRTECFLKTGKKDKEGKDIRVYTPPSGERTLRDLLKNLDEYLHYSKDDDLIKLAVLHYQFVAIHPFLDGNGRTARILSLLYLYDRGLVKAPILFLSYHILQQREKYYDLLQEVTEKGNLDKWINFMIDIIDITAETTKKKVDKIIDTVNLISMKLKETYPLAHAPISYVIFQKHYVRISDFVDNGLGTRKTASKYLSKLEELGILKSIKIGRDKLYLNLPYFQILQTPLE